MNLCLEMLTFVCAYIQAMVTDHTPRSHSNSGPGSESELFQSAKLEQLVELSPPENCLQGGAAPAPSNDVQLRRGVAVLELSGVHGFLVSGDQREDTCDYICAWVSGFYT